MGSYEKGDSRLVKQWTDSVLGWTASGLFFLAILDTPEIMNHFQLLSLCYNPLEKSNFPSI